MGPPPQQQKTIPVRPWLWRSLWPVLLAATIFFASSRSQIAAPPGIPFLDKIVHFGVYGLLATLAVRVFFHARRPGRNMLIAIALASLYGVSDEFHQSFTPGRSVELADWVADTTGAALAVSLYSFWAAWRRLLEFSIWRRAAHPAAKIGSSEMSSAVSRESAP
jgi:VanZ family protein